MVESAQHIDKALDYMKKGKKNSRYLDQALLEAREAVRIATDWSDTHDVLAMVLYQKGDLGGALREFVNALELSPDNPTYQKHYTLIQEEIWARRAAAAAATSPQPAESVNAGNQPARTYGGIGARFGTRDPVTCPSTREPVSGPISVEQATLYFMCSREGTQRGPLELVENLTLEVGQGRPASYLDSRDIDHDSLVYPIRGSFTIYTCYTPDPRNVGRNCRTSDEPQATGKCYRTTFGDWRCSMVGAGSRSFREYVPPPRN
jgi:hypothetical protein